MMQLMRRLVGRRGSDRPATRRRPVRPGVESLDQRNVPAATVLSVGDVTGSALGNQFASSTDRTVARSSSSGNYAVVWKANELNRTGIFVRLFRTNNTPLTGAMRVGTTGANDFEPSIAMNSLGQFAVAWRGPSRYLLDIKVQRFTAIGAHTGPTVAVAATSQIESEPSVGLDNYGNVMVAYSHQYESDDDDIYVWTQRPSGAVSTFKLATAGVKEHNPSLALNANGSGVVAYESDYSDVDHDIYARRIKTGGTAGLPGVVGGAITVNSGGADQYDPSAAISPAGNFVVSYTEASGGGVIQQVYARQFGAANNYRGQVSVGVASDIRSEFSSSAALDTYGHFIVAYTRAYSSSDRDVLAQVFNGDNSARGPAFNVSALGGIDERLPTVALGVADLTFNYSGGSYFGQAVFSFETYGRKNDANGKKGYGMSAARAFSL